MALVMLKRYAKFLMPTIKRRVKLPFPAFLMCRFVVFTTVRKKTTLLKLLLWANAIYCSFFTYEFGEQRAGLFQL